ncbi:MAG: alpha/beta fold hydrolase [Deltaproteobacteria bacterium]|nr:alpha/beta fold hydrolase [Deltaproteobacteria bacterium]
MSTAELRVREEGLEVLGRGARIFHGGAGPAVLLIHGGWGGARSHWETVFEPLAEGFEVVAPDLPGFEDGVPGGPHSVDDYADWLVALLDALGLSRPCAWATFRGLGRVVPRVPPPRSLRGSRRGQRHPHASHASAAAPARRPRPRARRAPPSGQAHRLYARGAGEGLPRPVAGPP